MWNVVVIDDSEKGVTSVGSSLLLDVSSHLFSFYTRLPREQEEGGCSYCWFRAVSEKLSLPVSATDSELEERIIQHLAVAAAMGRARHIARREGPRGRSSAQRCPHFLMFSTNPNAPPPASSSTPEVSVSGQDSSIIAVGEGSGQLLTQPSSFQADEVSASGSGSNAAVNQLGTSPNNRRIPSQSSSNNQDRAGPSDLQSFSESIKSRLSAMSMRHLETGNSNIISYCLDNVPESRNEDSAGVATVSHMMEHLETRDSRTSSAESNVLEVNLPVGHA
ncbi:hypothetical protein RND71_010121 [Anisodus tanguticus]|uniref:Uncharacterized protein n=1 Tax=Anisodus tanguticus TaxID=243964 RepID=A0AAE1VNJ3_9SOLA|nr:hypothetical protein RND71_010121 [Anisodus tanguticus]